MKKIIALLAVVMMVFSLAACQTTTEPAAEVTATPETVEAAEEPAAEAPAEEPALKIGVILVHDDNTGYDAAHIEGIKTAAANVGIPDTSIIWKYNIGEDETCYDTAIDLVEQGCTYIFSDSYGHQTHMQQAASENPDVTFVSMTGDGAALSGLPNFKNAFTHTFESRYVSGVVAGMKLKEMLDAGVVTDPYVGYVGAYPYAEVVSGFTGFYLGIKSIVPDAHMDVTYTNSWYDPTAEAEAANALISKGCCIISQHADSTGAPSAVQAALDAGTPVYCVGYNIDMLAVAPTAALTSAQNNWSAYYTYAFNCALTGEDIATDWSEGYATGANMISTLGPSCAAGTQEKVDEVIAGIIDGTVNVFDTSTFTVGGAVLDPGTFFIDTDGDWVPDSGTAIENGIFYESQLRSAPYFGIIIDGITTLN
ncbi:MAG TPA: BMP family ABC transporter substrate-binding protein [Clostridia bacterium]|jgi:basic membrane protein A|nr:BMP family ABC transporter substrate-binding protein [Clostridia bacterium]